MPDQLDLFYIKKKETFFRLEERGLKKRHCQPNWFSSKPRKRDRSIASSAPLAFRAGRGGIDLHIPPPIQIKMGGGRASLSKRPGQLLGREGLEARLEAEA